MSQWFATLCEDRREWVASTRKNKFDHGIRQATVEKYADPEHFVYELLQNAEDQGATEACFELTPVGLWFRHNGAHFQQRDVENITGLGNSDKPEQANKIGRFGIGFKSVFVVTESPRIYAWLEDEPFAFSIEDLVVPVRVEYPESLRRPGWTQFWLPFRQDKSAVLRERIREKLHGLGAGTLLFLRSLTSVEWKTEKGDGIFLAQRDKKICTMVEDSRVEGRPRRLEKRYFVCDQTVPSEESDRDLSVRIAFQMKKGADGGFFIAPEAGQTAVHVFFPTEEKAGLKFLLHAPFLLTDNRANVKRGEPINQTLITECANLLKFALLSLADEKLITTSTLQALPLDKSQFPPDSFYHPLWQACVEAFKRFPLLPTAGGGYVRAEQGVLSRSSDLRTLLDSSHLSRLLNRQGADWLSDEISEVRTPDLWTQLRSPDVLGIPVMDNEYFATRVSDTFLQVQSDAWMTQFYGVLGGIPSVWRKGEAGRSPGPLRNKPIIRTESGLHKLPFHADGSPALFLAHPGATPDPAAADRTVRGVCAEDEKARHFLKELGLQEPDLVDEVLGVILPLYEQKPQRTPEEYEADLNAIALALESPRAERVREKLRRSCVVRAVDCHGRDCGFVTPLLVYTRTEELDIWFTGNPYIWFVHPTVEILPAWQRIRRLMPEAAPDKVRCEYREGDDSVYDYVLVESSFGRHRRGLFSFDPDATLHGLEWALKHITPDRARFLWGFLCQHHHLIKGWVQTSTKKSFADPDEDIEWSELGALCRDHAWLPQEDGSWYKPGELFLNDLPDGFDRVSDRAAKVAEQLEMQKSELDEVAQKIGMSASEISFVRDNAAAFRLWMAEMQKRKTQESTGGSEGAVEYTVDDSVGDGLPEFPVAAVLDVQRRGEKVAGEARQATPKTYEVRARSVRVSVSEVSEAKRAYLSHAYTNRDGQMVCQICRDEMPFKFRDGSYYFEAVQCLSNLGQEHEQNYLALCPVCAAKYCYANEATPVEIQQTLRSCEQDTIEVPLAGAKHEVRFVQRHIVDLKSILNSTGKSL